MDPDIKSLAGTDLWRTHTLLTYLLSSADLTRSPSDVDHHEDAVWYVGSVHAPDGGLTLLLVRLGNSGLKISKIILGCMSYGDKRWAEWVLPEEEAIEHIKYAYVTQW